MTEFPLRVLRFAPRLGLVVLCVLLGGALPSWADEADTVGGFELERGAGMGGMRFYQPDTWGVVQTRLSNHRDEARSAFINTYLGNRPNQQFASDVWLPPRSSRQVTLPIRPPGDLDEEAQSVGIQTQLIDTTARPVRTSSWEPGELILRAGTMQTAVVRGDSGGGDDVAEAVRAMRIAHNLPRGVSYVRPGDLPPSRPAMEAVDHLVVASPLEGVVRQQRQVLRNWVHRGGRLWIVLDQARARDWEAVFGSSWTIEELDRVRLSRFTVEGEDESLSFDEDYPFEHVRVDAGGMPVTHWVEGYPAALRQRFGAGEVLVTTIDSRVWLGDEEDEDGNTLPSEVFASLTDLVAGGEERPAAARRARLGRFESYLEEEVGYEIIGRGFVLSVLGGFALVLVLSGFWLVRKDRLEWVSLVTVGGAALSAVILIGTGIARQAELPTTLVSTHFLEATADGEAVMDTARVGLYRPPDGPEQVRLRGTAEAIAWPVDAAERGVRLIWQGQHRWRLDNFALSAGAVRSLTVDRVLPLADRPEGRLSLDEQGMDVTVSGEGLEALEDAVLLGPSGHMALRYEGPGQLRASRDQVLEAGEFIDVPILSQRQIRRQRVYRNVTQDREAFTRPALLGWTDQVDAGVELDAEAERRHQALVSLPLHVRRPEAGQRVFVPAALLEMSPYRDEAGEAAGMVYDVNQREWLPAISQPSTFLMAFELPEALAGLELEQVRLRLNLQAPGWDVSLIRLDGEGGVREIDAPVQPAGGQSINLDAAEAPQPDEQGRIILGLKVEMDAMAQAQPWRIRQMTLEAVGVGREAR